MRKAGVCVCSFIHRLVGDLGLVVEEPSRWQEHRCSAPGMALCQVHSERPGWLGDPGRRQAGTLGQLPREGLTSRQGGRTFQKEEVVCVGSGGVREDDLIGLAVEQVR